ncbi:MAG TPA: LppX_LprAFG lipoprotein [Thermomicrobiaceae bacterium]|nr:LppX_LprAFG lipoprotein [Thermomicrobiaceae bacterium]
MERLRLSRIVVLAIAATVLLVACGHPTVARQNTPPPTPTPTPTPRDILNSASQRFAQVNSAHYQLQIQGSVYLDPQKTLQLRGAQGDLLRPDSATAKAQVSLAGATLTVNMIAIGQNEYITNFLTGQWERAPQGLSYNPAVIFSNQNGIPAVLSKVQNVTMVGTETVSSTPTQHLRGTVARSDVQSLTGSAFHSNTLNFDIWLTTSTRDIVKVVLQDPGTEQGATPTTWTLLITNINAPVRITAPAL